MTERDILRNGKVILLVDWLSPVLPGALAQAGFRVVCYSLNGYMIAEIEAEYPHDVNQ